MSLKIFPDYDGEIPKHVLTLWEMLGDTPVNDDGDIEVQFLDFEAGTPRSFIWLWFQNTFNLFVGSRQDWEKYKEEERKHDAG